MKDLIQMSIYLLGHKMNNISSEKNGFFDKMKYIVNLGRLYMI